MIIAENGEFYVRIESDNDIEYHFFNNNYDNAIKFCNKRNIDIKIIKKWFNFFE